MIKRLWNSYIREKFIPIYFSLLFVLLFLVCFPSFFDPPRSDHWFMLYFFHNLENFPGTHNWLHVLNIDPFLHVSFHPLTYLMLYLQHLIFGANFIYFNHIFNFILYCIAILLLYKLIMNFCKDRILVAAFLGVFAFFFSHFDIVSWPFHNYIIFGFCSFLLGFILYIKYLKSGQKLLLFFVAVLFLSGMLCYSTFAPWPFAIIILSYIDGINEKSSVKKNKLRASYISVIGVVYLLYTAIFFLTKLIKTYDEMVIPLRDFFYLNPIVVFALFFNILYNNILVNLIPLIACPISQQININMGGFIEGLSSAPAVLKSAIFFGGGLSMVLFIWLVIYLFIQKRLKDLKIFMFFTFLLFSELFILFYCRAITNTFTYIFEQFRYQYIPNALLILVILFLLENIIKPSQRKRTAIMVILFMVFILNISITRYHILFVSRELTPLKKILSDIKNGIKTGQINAENKLYIEDDITENLPPLCWNRSMGRRFMKGTYQWMFNKKEVKYFSSTIEDAKWVITKKDHEMKRK